MHNETSPEKALLLELLDYITEVEKLKIKPAFSIPGDSPFVAYQHELGELPELQYNLQSDGDEVWLRIPRLREIAAPEPDEKLNPWIILPKSPEKIPETRPDIITHDGEHEVIERLDAHPEIQNLFDGYLANQWQPWVSTERPRRKTIACYNKLFALQQAIALDGAEASFELVWGIGYAIWKKQDFPTAVKYPLLIQTCEITLNEQTFDLEIRPRDVNPRLETDCYVEMELPNVTQLEAFWRSLLDAGANRVNPFETSTYEGTLRAAVGYLDSSGRYSEGTESTVLSVPDEHLRITDTWVIFARKRSGDFIVADVENMKEAIKNADSLPSLIEGFVKHGDSTLRVQPEQPFRGLSGSDGDAGAMELYFPMPYNDEQVSIVQKLHANDGVVVQGPPGTGKTHTIANIICHYLAQGKRVLVTAKGESALTVLREKIPEGVRDLSVALLANERDGMKQFEHSIQTIASRVAQINPTRVATNIVAAEEKLNQLHSKIAHLDRTVRDYAVQHIRDDHPFQGRTMAAEEMAKIVLQQAEAHQWFDDDPVPVKGGVLPFADTDINALRRARMAVRSDLIYLGHRLPSPDDFPAWPDLLELHRDLVKAKAIDASIAQGSTLALVDSRVETFGKGQALLKFLDERMRLKTRLADTGRPWPELLGGTFARMSVEDPVLQVLYAVLEDIRKLEQQRKELLAHAVEVPVDAELNIDVVSAIVRLVAGKRAFTVPFGKREARKVIGTVTVAGITPKTSEEWMIVQTRLNWRADARKLLVRWNALAGEFGLPYSDAGVEDGFKQVVQWQLCIDDARELTFNYDAHLNSRIQDVFGKTVSGQMQARGEPFVASIYSSLQAHIDKGRLAYAQTQRDELVRKLYGCTGPIVDNIRAFLKEKLSSIDAEESTLEGHWEKLHSRLHQLTSLRPKFDEIERVTDAISTAGAKKWATRLRTEPASSDLDAAIPASWREAWEWRQAVIFLDKIDVHQRMRHLLEDRASLTDALAKTYQELVAEKAWLEVYKNSPPAVRQALQAYLNAVQAIGKGTGKKAGIYRRDARTAMERAYQAVSCWILPQWRVSEVIPAEIGLFDLIIIDEASQSEISALPALLRGQKVLVVGDHHQVSPSAIGISTEQIKTLVNRFLANQPFGSDMVPGKSIYDFARVVFAGNSVMLKEHFRCVPAIIEFSSREFYQDEIKPLRIPKANERLDPPLVDVFVKGGARGKGKKSDVNSAEAKAIVDEIKIILADPVFAGRSIGIVTLLGTEQARYIHELIHYQIPLDEIVARRIHAGHPPVFQGQERDIMMVSMVLGSEDRAATNRAEIQQRFNVALSRARDRMYLFRSVRETDVSEKSLNGRVLSHFRQPFWRDVRKDQTLRERCESGFEREMFDELVKRGYRVEPQVRSGGYRIDFVIEGNEGRRLAIECDGDRFHGPGQWQDDMARQRVLERAGWTFWRCFASSFVRRREAVMDDLVQTLDKLGIEPLGADSVDTTVWVACKEVDPYGVEGIMTESAVQAPSAVDHDLPAATSTPTAPIPVSGQADLFVSIPEPRPIVAPVDRVLTDPSSLVIVPYSLTAEPGQADIFTRAPKPALVSAPVVPKKTTTRYLQSNPITAVTMIDPKSFMDDHYTETLDDMINHVIEHEGPVPGGIILWRIARAHGWSCPFTRMRNRIWHLLWRDYRQYSTCEDAGHFYWPTRLNPAELPPFRPSGNKDSIRKPKHICLPELTSLAYEVIANGKQGEDALHAMSRKLGFDVLPPTHRPRLQKALTAAMSG